MPVRVRCRCGQELVLRYGEWVYAFLGLALLAVLVNMVALLLLYFRLEEISRSVHSSGGVQAGAPAPAPPSRPAAAPPAGTPGTGREQSAGGQPSGGSLPKESKTPTAPATPEKPEKTGYQEKPQEKARVPANVKEPAGSPRAKDSAELVQGKEAERGGEAAQGAGARAGPPSRPLTAPQDLPESFLSSVASREPSGRRPDSPSAVLEKVGPPRGSALVDAPPLLRLLLLERGAERELPTYALLSDPDDRLRRMALERAAAEPIPPEGTGDGERARLLIRSAANMLSGESRGQDLLRSAGLSGSPGQLSPEDARRLESILGGLRTRAATILSDPAARALRDFLTEESTRGMDVILLIDVTKSMEPHLESTRQDLLWLLRALPWAVPGTRSGIVLFRDELETAVRFSTDPAAAVDTLRQARAEGGGDVPEGVHVALRAALSLGRFDWRPSALKHLIVLGDEPPSYAERGSALLLVAQALRQGGYRTHAVCFETDAEFQEREPFFASLARRGGGRYRLVKKTERVGPEILMCLFPPEAHPCLDGVYRALRGA